MSLEELFLRLTAERERRRKDAIYNGTAFAGDEHGLLAPPSENGSTRATTSNGKARYEDLKQRNSDWWS